MNKLALLYDKYYRFTSLENAQNLLEEIINFDVNNYWEFIEDAPTILRNVDSYNNIEMITSGTFSIAKTYRFGPYSVFWIKNIEKFIKNPQNRLVILLKVMLSVKPCMVVPFPIQYNPYNYCVNGNWIGDTPALLRSFDSLPQEQLVIASDPKIFLYLSRDEEFLAHAEAKKWQLMSMDSEPLFPRSPFQERSIYVNDNMVNWVNGLNFFECPHGTKHFLPIFLEREGSTVNLLNLVGDERDDDDVWQIEQNISKCACGRDYLKLTFMPHKSVAIVKNNGEFFYEPDFAEELIGSYLCFQFVQQDDKIKVLYTGNMPEQDHTTISKFLEYHGFQCYEFIENMFIFTGNNKTAAFYSNIKNKPILEYPYMWRPLKIAL